MTERREGRTGFISSPAGIALCVFLAVAALLLLVEHRAHVFGAWPLLLVLLCLGMHYFMHRGHGRDDSGGRSHDDR